MVADKRSFCYSLLLAVAVLCIDQASKWLVLATLGVPDHKLVEICPGFNLALVWNRGISFGIFASRNQPLILVVMALVITVILLNWLYKNTSRLAALALGCVIGGAIGNVIDRLRFGAVVDFLDVHVGPYHWPAFNIADSAIFIGVVLLCAGSIFTPRQ
jgi:signal peptidase II